MDVVGFILLIFNFVNLIILLPIIYPILLVFIKKCECAVTPEFVYIFVYIIFTIGLLIVTTLINMNFHVKFLAHMNNRIRILTVVYFLMTLVFVETATRYINQQTSRNASNPCTCVDTHYEKWMTYIVYIRWISVYFFSVILISAGLYLFVRSERHPFSFPGTRHL